MLLKNRRQSFDLQAVTNLVSVGIKDIILLTGHKQEQIRGCLKGTNQSRLKYVFCGDPYQTPLNTISTLLKAKKLIDGPFLCLHGDILLSPDVIFGAMESFSKYPDATMLITVSNEVKIAASHARVVYNSRSLIVSNVQPPNHSQADVWIGLDIYQPGILSHYCQNPSIKSQKDLAEAVLSAKGVIKVKQYNHGWVHLVTPQDLIQC